MQMMLEGSKSYWSWACFLRAVINKTVSKQAIFKRMTKSWVATIKVLLQEVIAQQVGTGIKPRLFKHFCNVLLHDSTTIHLPDVMQEKFKGNVSRGKKKSVAKLNIILNIFSGYCPVMEWTSYTVNEQRLSPTILQIAKRGDLVIRDLGYFVLDVFRQMQDGGIYFLSRWKYGVGLYDIYSGNAISLLKLLKSKKRLDCQVLLGKEKLRVRLVAIKLANAQAEIRRRKARQNRNKRVNYRKDYYALLDYIIFITTVEHTIWNYRQVAEAYRVRWNIEILFKSWKSGFHIEPLIPEARTNTERVESTLYLMLIYIAWFQLLIYTPMRLDLSNHLSVIRMAKLIKRHTLDWIQGMSRSLKKEIEYYCCYDTRHDRVNAVAHLNQFCLTLS
jgi:hypothetical protein